MFKSSHGSSSTTNTSLFAQQQALAIEAAKQNDLAALQVLLGIDHEDYNQKIEEKKGKNLGQLTKANIASNPSYLRAEFYPRIIAVLEAFNAKTSFAPQDLNDALDAIFPEMEAHVIKRYQEHMEATHSGILDTQMVPVKVKRNAEYELELDEAAQAVLQHYKEKILAPFFAEMRNTTVTAVKNISKEDIPDSLDWLNSELEGFDAMQVKSNKGIQKFQKPIDEALAMYDVAYSTNRDRVWRALPTIRRLASPGCAALLHEGKTEEEIRKLPASELAGTPIETIINQIEDEIKVLDLYMVRVPVETIDSRGYTLLFLAALAENVSPSEREFDKVVRRLQTMELLLRDYKATPFVHAPGDPNLTLFSLFNKKSSCSRSFLRIIYDYAAKNYPEHKLFEGGLDAAISQQVDADEFNSIIKSEIKEIKDHVTAYKNERIDHPSAFRSFFESKFPSLKTAAGRQDEVDDYLAAITYVEQYLDMDLLLILIDEFSKPLIIERGIMGTSSLHDPVKKIADTYERPPRIEKREELYTTALVSLIEKLQESKKIILEVRSENTALKNENESLKSRNAALEAELARLKGGVSATSTTVLSTTAWGGAAGSSSSHGSSSSSSSSASHVASRSRSPSPSTSLGVGDD